MRPDIVIEHVSGRYVFSGETDQGREWLENRSTAPLCQRIGRSLAVEDDLLAKNLAHSAVADGLDILE
jgi:dTDP-4-dehydrorhamnose reductase